MGEEIICSYNYSELLINTLFDINNNLIEKVFNTNNEKFMKILLDVAIYFGKTIFSVSENTIKQCCEKYKFHQMSQKYEDYQDLLLTNNELIHLSEMHGLTFILNSFIRASQYKKITVNWSNVIDDIEKAYGKTFIEKGIDSSVSSFKLKFYKSLNVDKFILVLEKTHRNIKKLKSLQFSKLFEKYQISEEIICESIRYCERHSLIKTSEFLKKFFLVLVRIDNASVKYSKHISTFGAGKKREHEYEHDDSHCKFKVIISEL